MLHLYIFTFIKLKHFSSKLEKQGGFFLKNMLSISKYKYKS